jgi:hypothetical protein
MKKKYQYLIGTICFLFMTFFCYSNSEKYGDLITIFFGVSSVLSIAILLSEIINENKNE